MKFFRLRANRASKNNKRLRSRHVIDVMPVPKAQLTKVCRIKHFLSPDEIAKVMFVADNSDLPIYTTNAYDDVSPAGDPLHTTMYLQSDNLFESQLPWLHSKILRLVKRLNAHNGWGFDLRRGLCNVRVAEYHEMEPGGALRDQTHYDIGSLVTVDIMLQEAVQGAVFSTLELENSNPNENGIHSVTFLKPHSFTAGDALVFVSHKYHSVSPLLIGRRKVLVVEFWSGVLCVCGHRCDHPIKGVCSFVTEQ